MDNTDSDGVPAKTYSAPWRRFRLTIVGLDRARADAESASDAAQGAEAAPVAVLSRYAVPY
jgi:hypothetical protein